MFWPFVARLVCGVSTERIKILRQILPACMFWVWHIWATVWTRNFKRDDMASHTCSSVPAKRRIQRRGCKRSMYSTILHNLNEDWSSAICFIAQSWTLNEVGTDDTMGADGFGMEEVVPTLPDQFLGFCTCKLESRHRRCWPICAVCPCWSLG